MNIYTSPALESLFTRPSIEDPRSVGLLYKEMEDIGYDTAYSYENSHDPFLPLALAAEHTRNIRLGTSIAVAFPRNPMNLANVGWDLQAITGGRFVLGLGPQIPAHIEKRFGCTWSQPAERMRELVLAIRAIWDCWEDKAPLRFEGKFYRHTLMTPRFSPGPNPFGPPPIHVGGFGPLMTAVAGEVADGLEVHPFNSRRSLLENVLPAVEKGLARSGRSRSNFEISCATVVVTADTEEEFALAKWHAKRQLGFYGSTPPYRPTLICHGWDDLHKELNRLSKEGRWDDMADLIDDDILEALTVVGERHEIAAKLLARYDGITDSFGLSHVRYPDPAHWADVVRDLKSMSAAR